MATAKTKSKADDVSLEGVLDAADVLLAVSPLTITNMPFLGMHLLQACCRDAGINTRVFYSNLPYSNLIGGDLHKTISSDFYLLLGERIFSAAAFGHPSTSINRVMHKFSDPAWVPDHMWKNERDIKAPHVPEPVVPFRKWLDKLDLEQLESVTVNWTRTLARQIVKIGFRIVGCSTTLGGLIPGIALLNCIKRTDPDVITILGGALCQAEMAEGVLSLNTGIDYIFSGEGEITFPAFAGQVLEGRLPKEKIIYGEDVYDLDASPLPEYRDYVLQREKLSSNKSSGKESYPILFETSRGCGYGKCTFCGLNGKNNLIRVKSPDTIIQNLKTLVAHHNTNVIVMTDNMMPYRYFETLIPRISTGIPPIRIIYEMKVDLTLDQVLSLKKANITFRPGIESLSPSLLRRMNKPYTVRGNIALLRYSRSAGMDVEWALLFGFPGDIIGEYEEMTSLLPLIRHLQPPKEMVPLMLSRYSRYHRSPGMFAISNLQPAEALKDSLPSHADLDKAAYFFSAEFPSQSRENPEIITALWEEYQVWKHSWAIFKTIPSETLLPTLHVHRKNQKHYVLEDTRGLPGRPKRMEIDGDRASLILVSRPLETVPAVDLHWAADAGLGVVRESWFIPLATAEPILLQEFERDYKQDV